LAEQVGLSVAAIGALERGERRRPYPDTVRRLVQALGLTDDERSALVRAVSAPRGAVTPRDAAPVVSPPPASALPASLTPFVGRDVELAALRQTLEAAAEGRPELVLISGEPGIGKTRLQTELARRAEGRGWL